MNLYLVKYRIPKRTWEDYERYVVASSPDKAADIVRNDIAFSTYELHSITVIQKGIEVEMR